MMAVDSSEEFRRLDRRHVAEVPVVCGDAFVDGVVEGEVGVMADFVEAVDYGRAGRLRLQRRWTGFFTTLRAQRFWNDSSPDVCGGYGIGGGSRWFVGFC